MVVKAQEEIDNMSAQMVLDVTNDEIIQLEAKRKEQIGNGER